MDLQCTTCTRILKVKLSVSGTKPHVVNKSRYVLKFYQRPNCFSCDFWWNTNVTPLDQAPFNIMSSSPFRSAQWFHCDRFALQSVPSGGGWTWMLFTHRRHLNLYRKWKRHCYVGLKTTFREHCHSAWRTVAVITRCSGGRVPLYCLCSFILLQTRQLTCHEYHLECPHSNGTSLSIPQLRSVFLHLPLYLPRSCSELFCGLDVERSFPQ